MWTQGEKKKPEFTNRKKISLYCPFKVASSPKVLSHFPGRWSSITAGTRKAVVRTALYFCCFARISDNNLLQLLSPLLSFASAKNVVAVITIKFVAWLVWSPYKHTSLWEAVLNSEVTVSHTLRSHFPWGCSVRLSWETESLSTVKPEKMPTQRLFR